MKRRFIWLCGLVLLSIPALSPAADPLQGFLSGVHPASHSNTLEIFTLLTVLSFIPLIVIAVTPFTRIIVVLSLLRYALGLQQTPPNIVLITLAFFLTLFSMYPVLKTINHDAYQPYASKKIPLKQALERGEHSLKQFMIRQTRKADYDAMLTIAHQHAAKSSSDVNLVSLVPAYMLSELTSAFEIGFVIFLPFLLIDLVVAAILMSLGMIMVPPTTISLPIKIMLFVLINGWALLAQTLLTSIHT